MARQRALDLLSLRTPVFTNASKGTLCQGNSYLAVKAWEYGIISSNADSVESDAQLLIPGHLTHVLAVETNKEPNQNHEYGTRSIEDGVGHDCRALVCSERSNCFRSGVLEFITPFFTDRDLQFSRGDFFLVVF
jgi:hypothetical protein